MKVINISNFFAEFGGAFIEQLIILNEQLIKQGNESILIFPEEARYTKWAKNLSEKYLEDYGNHSCIYDFLHSNFV